jgi:hypothetical protein
VLAISSRAPVPSRDEQGAIIIIAIVMNRRPSHPLRISSPSPSLLFSRAKENT